MIALEALGSREGQAYLGAAAVTAIVTAALGVNTLQRFMREEDLREAYAAASREDGNAAGLLGKLRTSDPRDVDVRIALGSIESERGEEDPERLEIAEKLFAEALAIDPRRDAAIVGQAATRLRMAMAGTPAGRAAAVEGAAEVLAGASDCADVTVLQAAILILRRQPAEALKMLDGAPLAPGVSLSATRGWHWNRAVAAILTGDGRALELALPAYLMRPHQLPGELSKDDAPEFTGPRTDPSRVLAAAYRVSLVGASGSPEVVSARCDLARRALGAKFDLGQGLVPGRFQPVGRDLGAGWNALGMALLRQERLADAVTAFEKASRMSREPAFEFNYADALYRHALTLPVEDPKRSEALSRASSVYDGCHGRLRKQEGREGTRALAATNAAAISFAAGHAGPAAARFAGADDKDFADLGRRYRNLGALYDHAKNMSCLAAYKKALENGAPDSDQIQRRIRDWEERKGLRR